MINFANCSLARSNDFPCFFALRLYPDNSGLHFWSCHISSQSGYSNVVRYTACNTNVFGSIAPLELLQFEQHPTQLLSVCSSSLSRRSTVSAMSPQ
ncbi:hypothetical protein AR158_c680R [Paramecium bursaria Chlorella virus AR158]|uniref:hypothetical protein n=1 Tax=Paramecium bursaria Chlorella virus AR158 TaxID=380598 RepID=UPI00015AA83B|nr:hypothetical protein AR158_c680R [Paramecium bursaria Chlorella virus AR158]ABU44225.1 hypothetical protein AR158_c680R [Paramecium bursaria Chlorella virus AR158]